MKKSLLSMSMLHFSLAVFLCFSLSFCGGGDDDKPDADGDGIEDAKDNCVDVANPEQTNTDDDSMGDACDMDDDNDDVPDTRDAFPTDACASADNDKDDKPDTLVTGCTTSLTEDTDDDNDTVLDTDDVDADGDGLIEIATASELNNMRHNLAGTTYDDEMEDSTPGDTGDSTGCPAAQGTACESGSTGCCGYELVADIDFSDDGTGSPIDLSTDTMRNFDPIGNLSSGHFTAYLEGNGYTISGLEIDITGATAGNDDANDAAFIASCQGVVSNLILADAVINGRRRVAVLCATMDGGAARNVHIIDASVRQDNASSNIGSVGGLVGYMEGSSRINNSIARGDVSASNNRSLLYAGGLVGYMSSSHISNSVATGVFAVIGGFENRSFAGGLVGFMEGSSSVSNSIATRDVTSFTVNTFGGLVGSVVDRSSVSNSTATGDVVGSGGNATIRSTYAGGLVGLLESRSSISNSTATGDVSCSSDHPSVSIHIGGLVGSMVGISNSVSNSIATGYLFASFANEANVGGLGGFVIGTGSISNSYFNSEAMQILKRTVGQPTARQPGALRGVGSDADATGVTAKTLSQIQSLDASTLMWDDTKHWSGVGIDGQYPLLRYADNPHTDSVNECEFLPGFGNTDDDKVRCGDLLPLQELYRASGNLTFSNATIGIPTDSALEFFYNVSAATVTATYNLAPGVTLTASGVEDADGNATTDVSWNADSSGDGTTGQVTGIDANETFWLALTFQQAGVTHKVRWKFVRPMPSS